MIEHDGKRADDGDSGLVDCQEAWRATELMAGLSDRQLEMLTALLGTWSGTLGVAIDTAVRLSES